MGLCIFGEVKLVAIAVEQLALLATMSAGPTVFPRSSSDRGYFAEPHGVTL